MGFPKIGLGNWFKQAAAGAAGGFLNSAANVISKFVADPTEQAKALKELEEAKLKHEENMANIQVRANEIESDLEKAYLQDVGNARAMQIEALKQDDKFSKRFVYYLAIGIIVMAFIFDMCFFFVSYPERNHDIINMVAGTINSTGFAAVIYFFFGSSQGSKQSGDAMRKLIDKQN